MDSRTQANLPTLKRAYAQPLACGCKLSKCVCVCVFVCVCVCVCHNERKKVPDEWQARQVTPAIVQVSSIKHNVCACVCVCGGGGGAWVCVHACSIACVKAQEDAKAILEVHIQKPGTSTLALQALSLSPSLSLLAKQNHKRIRRCVWAKSRARRSRYCGGGKNLKGKFGGRWISHMFQGLLCWGTW